MGLIVNFLVAQYTHLQQLLFLLLSRQESTSQDYLETSVMLLN